MFFIEEEEPKRRTLNKRYKQDLHELQKGRCMYCGIKNDDIAYFDIDHKNPKSKNGGDDWINLQMLCGPCNRRKSASTDVSFRRKYNLKQNRAADGRPKPPTKRIPQSHFKDIDAELRSKPKPRPNQSQGNGMETLRRRMS